MKNCPVCGAVAFDDATTCYGCLHNYEDDSVVAGFDEEANQIMVPLMESPIEEPPRGAHRRVEVDQMDCPPEFTIHLVPSRSGSGTITWDCAVSLAS